MLARASIAQAWRPGSPRRAGARGGGAVTPRPFFGGRASTSALGRKRRGCGRGGFRRVGRRGCERRVRRGRPCGPTIGNDQSHRCASRCSNVPACSVIEPPFIAVPPLTRQRLSRRWRPVDDSLGSGRLRQRGPRPHLWRPLRLSRRSRAVDRLHGNGRSWLILLGPLACPPVTLTACLDGFLSHLASAVRGSSLDVVHTARLFMLAGPRRVKYLLGLPVRSELRKNGSLSGEEGSSDPRSSQYARPTL
jgi:hypothetical protein